MKKNKESNTSIAAKIDFYNKLLKYTIQYKYIIYNNQLIQN